MEENGSKERIWTEAQREAVFSTSGRVLVTASAGSGKTSVVTERAAELVRRGADFKNMLIVTFTVNAAAEMRARLLTRLEETYADFRREDVYAADIGTLHAFCKKLITQFFYKLGIDPGFIVAEAGELAGLKEAAADAVIAQGFKSGGEVFSALADFMATGKRRDFALKNTIKRIYEYSHNSAAPEKWLESAHAFCESSPAPCDKELAPYVKELASLARLFSEKYDELKNRDARLDFIDLERLALKLLDDREALEFVRSKYKYVFVDEYQDINPKQEAIIAKLAEGAGLFMVGDFKQSIYGFRSCEPEIFLSKIRDAKNHKVITLNDNFRSRPEILRFCNDVFAKLMTAESCGIDYDGESRFGAGLPFEKASEFPAVSCRFIRDGNAEAEARAIAAAVNGLLGEKIYIPKEKTSRPIEYGDIAILMSVVRGEYPRAVYRALLRMGVPVRSEINLSPCALAEVSLLVDFMRVIDNPMQDIPLAAVMRSCFFGFTDNELADIRREFPAEPFFHLCVGQMGTEGFVARDKCPPSPLVEKVRGFLSELERLKNIAGGVTAARLLEIICRDFDYGGNIASGGGGEDIQRAVEGFIGEVRANRFCLSLGGFVALADGFETAESAEPASGGANCVRLSSIHHAKGMEFPVVILAAAGLKFTDRNIRLPVVCDKDLGIAVKPWGGDVEENGESAFYRTAAKLFTAENREKQRLLYVALTRAQNHLVVTGSYKTKKNEGETCSSFLDWLRLYRSDLCEYVETDSQEQEEQKRTEHRGTGECAILIARAPRPPVFRPPVLYPFAAAAAAPAKTTASKILRGEQAGAYLSPPFVLDDGYGDGGREAGIAYHTLFKHINMSAVTQNEIVAEKERLTREGILTEAAAKHIDAGKAAACMNSPLLNRARRAGAVWREQDFIYLLESGGTETLIQGAIDLMFREDGGLVIADYKLSSLSGGDAAARYKKQLDIYAAAAESILGLPVKEKLLFLLNGGQIIKV